MTCEDCKKKTINLWINEKTSQHLCPDCMLKSNCGGAEKNDWITNDDYNEYRNQIISKNIKNIIVITKEQS